MQKSKLLQFRIQNFLLIAVIIIITGFLFSISASAQIISTSSLREIPLDQLPLPIDFSQGISLNYHNPSVETGLKQLTTGDFYDSNPDWSPDGQTVIFNSNRRLIYDPCHLIYVQDIYGLKPNELDPKTTVYPIMQPSVLTCYSNGFMVPKFEKPSNTKILTMEISWVFEYMRTETAGKSLPILRTRIDGADENNQSLLRISYGGYQIISDDGNILAWEVFYPSIYSEVRISPTNSIISGPIGQFGQSADSQGQVVFSINGRLGGISFSPDGKKIVVSAAKPNQGYDLYIVNSDGSGTPIQIIATGQTQGINNIQPSWSNDNHIAFSSNQTGRFEIYTINSDGTNLKQITDNGGFSPAWSPDSSKIAFISNRANPPYQNIWEVGVKINQLPTFPNLNQYKSDGQTPIQENGITTESTVVFKATLNDSDHDQVKLQVELRQFGESFTGQDDGGILNSDFVNSGQIASITRYGLISQSYHWRMRAVNSRGVVSGWQELGKIGNIDFEVKLVPLYTQARSPYPSWTDADSWFSQQYGTGNYSCWDKEFNRSTIRSCGCAITSQIMIMRFHYITTDVNDNDVNPLTFNNWLIVNNGYYLNGDIKWPKIQEYSKIKNQPGLGRLQYRGTKNFKDAATLDSYLADLNPVILYTKPKINEEIIGHFIVADGKLANTYTIKDPAWYNTKNLNQPKASYVYDYNNQFYGLRLFSPTIAGVDSISLNLASPAELLITDPQGRKLGKDPINNIEYNEIPDGSYYQEGIGNPFSEIPMPTKESKFIWIPNPLVGQYDIQVIGTDAGTYALETLAYDQNGQSKDIIQKGATAVNNIQTFELNYSKENIQETKSYRVVNIDIKPGSYPNSINLKSKGIIPIAVLTDNFFDAKDIATDSVVFSGASPIIRGKFEDVDKDGDLDLVLHFKTQLLQLSATDTEAVLTGKLNDNSLVKGIDSIKIVDYHK